MSIDVFDTGGTVQFTFVSSVAPDSAPTFKVIDAANNVSSFTSVSSDSTSFYSLYTMPNTEGLFIGEWVAVKTFTGSALPFIRRFVFKVSETKIVF